MNAETYRVLQDARRRLIEKGWCNDAVERDDGAACIIGALAGDAKVRLAAARFIAEELGLPPSYAAIGEWNDAQQSAGPVIALLDKVLTESGREPQTRATNGHGPRVSASEADRLPSRPDTESGPGMVPGESPGQATERRRHETPGPELQAVA